MPRLKLSAKCSRKFERTAPGSAGIRKPSATRASKPPTLATVKTFCTVAPSRRPRQLTQVSSAITSIATSCWLETWYESGRGTSTFPADTQGRNRPRNLAKPTATAAIVPVWITRNSVQP